MFKVLLLQRQLKQRWPIDIVRLCRRISNLLRRKNCRCHSSNSHRFGMLSNRSRQCHGCNRSSSICTRRSSWCHGCASSSCRCHRSSSIFARRSCRCHGCPRISSISVRRSCRRHLSQIQKNCCPAALNKQKNKETILVNSEWETDHHLFLFPFFFAPRWPSCCRVAHAVSTSLHHNHTRAAGPIEWGPELS